MTEQEENQIMAALALWRAVAMTSRVHPMDHPACKPFFEEHRPLSLEDIERLMSAPLSTVNAQGLISLKEAVEDTQITTARLRYELRRNGAKFVRCGGANVFTLSDVRKAMHVLRAQEERFKRRYNLEDVDDPTS